VNDSFYPLEEVLVDQSGWLRLLSQAAPEAQEWADDYRRRGGEDFTQRINQAIRFIHQGRTSEARTVLEQSSRNTVDTLRDAPTSIRNALESWRASASAYYHFSQLEFNRAETELVLSTEAVKMAIEERRFLLILGMRFINAELQRVRVARDRYRWDEMEKHAKIAWDLFENRRPLCVLDDESEIFYSDLQTLVASLVTESVHDGTAEEKLGKRLQRRLQALIAENYALPWMVIPHG